MAAKPQISGKSLAGFWILCGTAYVLIFAYFSCLSPLIVGSNKVFGITFWLDRDPGLWYMLSAHQMFADRQGVIFPGHPGLTLQLLLFFIQKAFYVLSGSEGDFSNFIARNIAMTFILSKIAISLIHVLSFWLLYKFSMKLLNSPRAAMIAVAGYSTSFPVLFFVSRISTEPLAIVFFLWSFIAAYNCADRIRTQNTGAAMATAAVAAFLATMGLMSKMHYLIFLPFFVLCCVVFGGGKLKAPLAKVVPISIAAAVVYVVSMCIFISLWSLLINWNDFFTLWRGSYAGGDAAGGGAGLVVNSISSKLSAISRFPLRNYLFSADMNYNGLFTLSEFPYISISLAGIFVFIRKNELKKINMAVWPALTVAIAFFAWLYQTSFYYLFVPLAFMSVFFGYYADIKLGASQSFSGRSIAGTILTIAFVFHFAAVCLAIQSRVGDVKQYNAGYSKVFNLFAARLDPGEKIGVIAHGKDSFRWLTGCNIENGLYFSSRGRTVLLNAALEDLLVVYDAGSMKEEEIAAKMKKDRVARTIYW